MLILHRIAQANETNSPDYLLDVYLVTAFVPKRDKKSLIIELKVTHLLTRRVWPTLLEESNELKFGSRVMKWSIFCCSVPSEKPEKRKVNNEIRKASKMYLPHRRCARKRR